jgi:hypothetical protein
VPAEARPEALELRVHRAADVHLGGVGPGASVLGEREGGIAGGRFRFRALPRGRLRVVALCRSSRALAGIASFVVDDDGRGYVPGIGLARERSVDLAVDAGICRR